MKPVGGAKMKRYPQWLHYTNAENSLLTLYIYTLFLHFFYAFLSIFSVKICSATAVNSRHHDMMSIERYADQSDCLFTGNIA